jgi:hypothetical protein
MVLKFVAFMGLAFSAQGYAFIEVSDVASMQVRPDGNYDVICRNGTFEVATETDIRANAVCLDEPLPESGILSVQVREDGMFDVLCKDLTREVATTEQIRDLLVCLGTNPPPSLAPLTAGRWVSKTCGFELSTIGLGKGSWNIVIDTVEGTCYKQFTFYCEEGENICLGAVTKGDSGKRALEIENRESACITFVDGTGPTCMVLEGSKVIEKANMEKDANDGALLN